jgi:hypothetical protein
MAVERSEFMCVSRIARTDSSTVSGSDGPLGLAQRGAFGLVGNGARSLHFPHLLDHLRSIDGVIRMVTPRKWSSELRVPRERRPPGALSRRPGPQPLCGGSEDTRASAQIRTADSTARNVSTPRVVNRHAPTPNIWCPKQSAVGSARVRPLPGPPPPPGEGCAPGGPLGETAKASAWMRTQFARVRSPWPPPTSGRRSGPGAWVGGESA